MDNLEIYTDHSDKEDDSNFQSAKNFVQPSVNANNENNNIDSGDENLLTGDTSILGGNQLLQSAVSEINTLYGQAIRGD